MYVRALITARDVAGGHIGDLRQGTDVAERRRVDGAGEGGIAMSIEDGAQVTPTAIEAGV